MALNAAGLDASSNGFKDSFPFLSLHTSGPVDSSAHESTASRQPANWAAPTAGNLTLTSAVNFVGGKSKGEVVRVGYWSTATGGLYGGGCLLTGDQSFNSAGEYTVTTISENVSSS
jgi:hypothetical protein